MVEPRIFREYDIRGVWGKDLTEDAVRTIGRAYAVYLKDKIKKDRPRLSIGFDARLSSPAIRDALVDVLSASGCDVLDIGLCPTPVQYFSLYHMDLDGGVMITGSHNPPEFNGMKLSVGKETITVLDDSVAFFIPEHVSDPSIRAPGEELWVEVTIPKKGPPRPIRLGVKKGGAITPLALR